MDVCIWQLACANQSVSSPSQSHTQPVYLSALLRTLWFVNQPCSTHTATDKSCLSHHGGFLSSIQTHSNFSLTFFSCRCSSKCCKLRHAVVSRCSSGLVLFFPECMKPPKNLAMDVFMKVYANTRKTCKNLQAHSHSLDACSDKQPQKLQETNTHTHKARDACQESSYTISPHAVWHGKIYARIQACKTELHPKTVQCTADWQPSPPMHLSFAQNLLLGLTPSVSSLCRSWSCCCADPIRFLMIGDYVVVGWGGIVSGYADIR